MACVADAGYLSRSLLPAVSRQCGGWPTNQTRASTYSLWIQRDYDLFYSLVDAGRRNCYARLKQPRPIGENDLPTRVSFYELAASSSNTVRKPSETIFTLGGRVSVLVRLMMTNAAVQGYMFSRYHT